MDITAQEIRAHRLHAHHLDQKAPMAALTDAAGACGLQNSPPGAWETALHNRLQGCTLQALHEALYHGKTLLQAWSYRGAPVVFPAAQSDIFLTPLMARAGEQPWIYTQGIAGALDHLQMPFDDALSYTMEAARYLDDHTVKTKEALDQTLADIIQDRLPAEQQARWRDPSMYGNPQRQTVGGAAVSFLLRPCSFASRVVFGERQGISPTFTSYRRWMGHPPTGAPDADKALMRKYLHCYGPTTRDAFMRWLGCSLPQARRLWEAVADETVAVQVAGKPCHVLAADMDGLTSAKADTERLLLLGAHDPYLDLRDRAIILADASLHKTVWKTVGNPGAVLKGGRIIGIWKPQARKDSLSVRVTLWEAVASAERRTLEQLIQAYAAFRQLHLQGCAIEGA